MAQKILVVEDEPAIADNIHYALSTEGFEVLWCATAGEATGILESQGPDLVVLDIGLPDRNGLELCKDIRRTSRIPVIFLTARASDVDKVVGLEIGGDDYMVKPFNPRELTARVKAVLRRACPGAAGSGDKSTSSETGKELFSVDRKRMVISYFGKPLPLSRYEFRILDVLSARPGQVFSRDQLMSMAWEEPDASMDRTVDTHIKTLRVKLRDVRPDLDPIRTHRGLGYSLKESV
jgi:two-component system catabolic regulation response regulator CreB